MLETTLRAGVVVIGRNEASILCQCLESVKAPVVYVDSGSTDTSVSIAKECGVCTLELADSSPYTAARARNIGFTKLLELHPKLEYIQFLDGDCILEKNWLSYAVNILAADQTLGAIFGRLQEADPSRSFYNKLCQLEWSTQPGPALHFGGITMIRASTFRQSNGYNALIVAGEDSELSVRIRAAGWNILSVDSDMAIHDANLTQFKQWLVRCVRSGHALAERASLHGASIFKDCVRDRRSTIIWGGVVPLISAAALYVGNPIGWLILMGYPFLARRIYVYRRKSHGDTANDALLYSLFCILAKPPQFFGLLTYYYRRIRRIAPKIFECD